MKILVLGHKGQIGSAFMDYASSVRNLEVHGLDILGTGSEYADLARPSERLQEEISWADCVLFLAYNVGGSKYLKTAEWTFDYVDENYRIMHSVFSICDQMYKPVVFGSSQMATMTHSPYGVMKRVGEFMCKSIDGLNVRFWNVYGIETDPEKYHVITDFVLDALHNGEITINSTGQEKRQFLYSVDCAKALYQVCINYRAIKIDMDLANLDSCDISNFEWNTIEDVASTIADNLGNIKVNTNSNLENYVDTQRDIMNEPNNILDPYWYATTSLSEGIDYIVNYHVENRSC